jgi:hypothetical protein
VTAGAGRRNRLSPGGGSSDVTLPQDTLVVPLADPHAVEAIAAFGRFASARGWVAATAAPASTRARSAPPAWRSCR